MPCYRIHKIKPAQGEQFRWSAHTAGPAIVRPKDYDGSVEIEASNPYALWKTMRQSDVALSPGDLLEQVSPVASPAPLFIAKYVGFEPAEWYNYQGADTQNL